MGGDIRLFPPTLDGTNYAVWKVRIEAYTMGKKHEVWSMMVNGVDKEYKEFTKEELEFNGSAKNIIFASISDNLFHQVSSCSKAKEMWDKLKTTHEGTQQQKDNQVGILVNDFELFKQKTGESIRDLVGRMNALINALKNMGKEYSTLELNRKLLNALSSEWKIKVIAIEEAKNLTMTPLDEIAGSLLTHEMNEARRSEGTMKKEKSIALQAQESSSDDDEDIALLSRRIARMLRGKRKFGNTSKVCYECRKPGHFKDECPTLKKKEENEKMMKKSTWRGDKKKKAFKATWSDSSEDEDNEGEEAGEEVNLCLMAKSSEGEVSADDISNEELSDALADLLVTFRGTRRELRKSKQENLKLVETISLMNEKLEKASISPFTEDEYTKKLGEEITKLERENTMLKGKLNSLESNVLCREEKISSPDEYHLLRQRYDQLLGSQKALEMLLGSQRSCMRREGLGYESNDKIKTDEGTKWVKEGTDEVVESLKQQNRSVSVDDEEKGKDLRNYLMDEAIRRDPRYKYSHSYGMLGNHRTIDKLFDPVVSNIRDSSRIEINRINSGQSSSTRDRLKPVSRIEDISHRRGIPRVPIPPNRFHGSDPYIIECRDHVQYQQSLNQPYFFPHTIPPYHIPLLSWETVDNNPRFRLPQLPPWVPMGWN